jgi:hypothetical protein
MAGALSNLQGQARALSLSVFIQYNCESLQLASLPILRTESSSSVQAQP